MVMISDSSRPVRRLIRVAGIVQGVGYRPFVYNQATALGLAGHVGNDAAGVFVEVEGSRDAIERLEEALSKQAPPMARVESVNGSWLTASGSSTFEIVESVAGNNRSTTFVSPDMSICDACLSEMRDPDDRRFGYAFTNCTNCGPRYSIIQNVPYDRAVTSMSRFEMCSLCRSEYELPSDRRFHAQPNACADCGPRLSYEEVSGELDTRSPVTKAARALLSGQTVAIKGLGGFHLACDASNGEAVSRLRVRKNRDSKPFAVMVANVEAARVICEVDSAEAELLSSIERPIVVLKRLVEASVVSEAVAPANHSLGVMLPYTPLHYLLLSEIENLIETPAVIVLTSGNTSDEPIVIDDGLATSTLLGSTADALLSHDRPIVARADDSVVRSAEWGPQVLRRSRGYAPTPIRAVPASDQTVLACGSQLKNTFTFLRDGQAFVSPHVGDLHAPSTVSAFESAIKHYEHLFSLQPDLFAHDLHPQYTSTRYALARGADNTIAVQHHEAHVASVMAESGLDGDVIGIAADGTGLGTDGTIWGGEFFAGGFSGFDRVNHFATVPLPGGEKAIKQPWRMGCVYLERAFGADFLELDIPFVQGVDKSAWNVLHRMIERGVQTPMTSSVGRLFDAISAMLGLVGENTYEGRAAIELEFQAMKVSDRADELAPYATETSPDGIRMDPMVHGIVADLLAKTPIPHIAYRAHLTIAEVMVQQARSIREASDLDRVVLGGGVFQNGLLTSIVTSLLTREGFGSYMNRLVPTNDGGLSLGQAAIAAARA